MTDCTHTDTAEIDTQVQTSGTAEYAIPEANIHALQAKVADLNKRAKRLKVEPVTLTVLRQEVRETRERNRKVKRLYHIVRITGETPRIKGWIFVATLDHASAEDETGKPVGVVVRTIPGETLPKEFREYNTTCEHCNTKRIRKETFVLRNAGDGRFFRVGRQCLKDFLGHDNPHAVGRQCEWLASFDEVLRDAENDGWGGGGWRDTYELPDYLTFVACQIRTVGWVSGSHAYSYGGRSTASAAFTDYSDSLSPKRVEERRAQRDPIMVPTEADAAQAEAAIEWIREVRNSDADLDDYMANLTVVCASDVMHTKNKGIAASLISAHLRHLEREIKRKTSLNLAKTSEFQGTVNQRQEWTLRVLGSNTFQGSYGPTTIVRLTDGTNAFTWYASGGIDLDTGATYHCKATVKKHEVYRHRDAKPNEPGIKTTYLNRLAVLARIGEQAA
jgi:hypothetical protein